VCCCGATLDASRHELRHRHALRQAALRQIEVPLLTESLSREELLKHPVLGKQYVGEYPFQAGQPDDVRKAYAEAMGIPG